MELLERAFGRALVMRAPAVATVVLTTVLAPLAAGIAVRSLAPGFAERAAAPLGNLAGVMLVAAALPVLVVAWPAFVPLIGSGVVLAIVAFTAVGLAAGHLLGGPDPEDRAVLALCSASRHPGVAMTIAAINFSEQNLVAAAVLLYLIASGIVTTPYLSWVRKKHPEAGSAATPPRRARA